MIQIVVNPFLVAPVNIPIEFAFRFLVAAKAQNIVNCVVKTRFKTDFFAELSPGAEVVTQIL